MLGTLLVNERDKRTLIEAARHGNYAWLDDYMASVEKDAEDMLKNPLKFFNVFRNWLYNNCMAITMAALCEKDCRLRLPEASALQNAVLGELEKYCSILDISDGFVTFSIDMDSDLEDPYENLSIESLNSLVSANCFINDIAYGEALSALADKYYDEDYFNNIHSEAVVHYALASMLGNSHGFYKLGKIVQDDKRAIAWYSKAFELGSLEAGFELGQILAVLDDPDANKVAVVLFLLHLINGDGKGDAINALGLCFKNRMGIRLSDYETAAKCFKFSALKDNCYGMFNLAECYEKGTGVPVDYSAAGKWYLSADKAGHPHGRGRTTSWGRWFCADRSGA